jgi:hypothetical protein
MRHTIPRGLLLSAFGLLLGTPAVATAQERYFAPPGQSGVRVDEEPRCEPEDCDVFDKKGRRRKVLPPVDGYSPPLGYVETKRPIRRAWIAGTAVLGGSWALSAITSALAYSWSGWWENPKDGGYLWGIVPLVGPVISSQVVDDPSDFYTGMSVTFSLLQVGGLVTLATGLSLEETVWARDDASLSLHVSPGLVGLGGTF